MIAADSQLIMASRVSMSITKSVQTPVSPKSPSKKGENCVFHSTYTFYFMKYVTPKSQDLLTKSDDKLDVLAPVEVIDPNFDVKFYKSEEGLLSKLSLGVAHYCFNSGFTCTAMYVRCSLTNFFHPLKENFL